MHFRTASDCMTMQVVVDTAVLVALLDSRDKWHAEARSLGTALRTAQAEVVFFRAITSHQQASITA
jgi:predicted nucleic acid-binding protein